jgi:hypothetical protein
MVLADSLEQRPDGWWAAKEVGLNVPRQSGKGNVLQAREIAGVVLFGDELITHSSHLFETSQEHFHKMLWLFESSADLQGKVKRVRRAHGSEGIDFMNGSRINIKARMAQGGRGFSGSVVVFDEIMDIKPGALDSLIPTMSSMWNPQVWYAGSAPIVGPASDEWRKIITNGREPGSPMCYLEWSCPMGTDLDDLDALYSANPGMPYGRPSVEFCTQVERKRLGDDGYGRERFGIWNPDEAKPKEIPESSWKAIQDPLAVPSDPMAFAVEMTPDRMTATISAVGADPDGIPVIVTVEHRERDLAPRWLIPALEKLWQREPKAIVIDPKSAAGTLIDEIELAGVTVTKCDLRDHIAAQAALFDAILAGEVKVRPSEPLDAAVTTAARRDVGGSWLWKSNPVTPATPLVAAGMALWGFTQEAPQKRRAVSQIG